MATAVPTRARARTLFAAVAAGALLLVTATSAFAHTPSVSLTCDTGLKVVLTQYNASNPNSVSVSIDGSAVTGSPFTFSSSFSQTWGGLDPYVAHTATVSVYAWDDPTGSKGWTKTFNKELAACQDPTTPPTEPPTLPPPPPPPTATPTATPTEPVITPTPTASASTSFEAETGTPKVTPPPTDSGVTGSGPGSGFGLILFAIAAAIALIVAVPSRRKATRR